MMRKPELMAPAGNFDCARAAVANGADSVYFGLPRFNARMRADNFTAEQLPELVRFLHEHRVRAIAALNILIFPNELADAERELIELEQAGVDAVIVQDLGVAWLARELGLRMEVHGSTQMTITSPEGLRFATRLGIKRVVLARELSLKEIAKCNGDPSLPSLEVFVHGALCVAYSGQCLTSEALGQRSANRGECAQACRLPYELVVDGAVKDLGDRRYLLSPQDLAAVREIPELIRLGVSAFKIEGRLKTPEYVAATTQVYRKAIDAAISCQSSAVGDSDFYKLEMTFSRGLYSGWLHGMNHQKLVHARFGKKRGPFVGFVRRVFPDHVEVDVQPAMQSNLRAGDGVVFDTGGNTEREQGGRLFEVRGNSLYFQREHINFSRIKVGDRVWKTSDPQLERELRRSFQGAVPRPKAQLDVTVSGDAGKPLAVEANIVGANCIRDSDGTSRWEIAPTERVESRMPLQTAQKRPLTTELLREQLGRLGETEFELGELHNELHGDVILPVSELNRLRRELVEKISAAAVCDRRNEKKEIGGRRPPLQLARLLDEVHSKRGVATRKPRLIALCRTMEQLSSALEVGCSEIYVDFEDLRRYADAVTLVRSHSNISTLQHSNTPALQSSAVPSVILATPRIQKAGEQGFFKVIETARPDGVLIRNLGALDYFRNSPLRRIGDFSLRAPNKTSFLM